MNIVFPRVWEAHNVISTGSICGQNDCVQLRLCTGKHLTQVSSTSSSSDWRGQVSCCPLVLKLRYNSMIYKRKRKACLSLREIWNLVYFACDETITKHSCMSMRGCKFTTCCAQRLSTGKQKSNCSDRFSGFCHNVNFLPQIIQFIALQVAAHNLSAAPLISRRSEAFKL